MFGCTTSSWCSHRLCPATSFAYTSSSCAGSLKPTEQVTTGRLSASDIYVTTEVESTPPLRKAPNGTSLRRRILTASRRMLSNSSSSSRSDRASGGGHGTSQYWDIDIDSAVQIRMCPAGNFRTLLKIVIGLGT